MTTPVFPARPISERKLHTYRGTFTVLLLSDAAIYVTLVAVRFLLLGTATPEDANLPLGLITAALLLLSGWFCRRALGAASVEDQSRLARNLRLASGLGLLALGALLIDWLTLDLDPQTLFGSSYLLAASYFGLHLLIGLITLLALHSSAAKGRYTRDNHWVVEAGALFWGLMVVLAWLLLLVVFYLL